MCLELLKEYYGGHSVEAQALRDNLITVYAIGWAVTQEMTETYPQIVPAAGEMDTGVAVSFDCEDGTLTDTLVIPEGTKALSIDPLNWKTDGTLADRSLNVGAVTETDAEPIPALCGAYIGGRGELAVTDVTPEEYPAQIGIFPDGSYHVYDIDYADYSLVRFLAREGYAVWRLDVAGIGQSEAVSDGFMPDPDYAAEDIGAAVEEIVRITGQDKIDLLGWSWGTITASRYAARNSEHLNKLVLYAPILSGLGDYEVAEPFPHNTWEHEGSVLEVIPGGSHVAYLEEPYYRDFQDRLIAFLGS